MLSRIMRHPAGFMRKALKRNFLAGPFARSEPAATRPDYWLNRFSGVGLSLATPGGAAAPAQAASEAEPAAGAVALPRVGAPADGGGTPAGGSLPRQGGKAASFLLSATKRATQT